MRTVRSLRASRPAEKKADAEKYRREQVPEWERKLREKLSSAKVTLDLKDKTFGEAIQAISERSGVNIVLHPEIPGSIVKEKVDKAFTSRSPKEILGVLLSSRKLDYEFKENVVFIDTAERIKARREGAARSKITWEEARKTAAPLLEKKVGIELRGKRVCESVGGSIHPARAEYAAVSARLGEVPGRRPEAARGGRQAACRASHGEGDLQVGLLGEDDPHRRSPAAMIH